MAIQETIGNVFNGMVTLIGELQESGAPPELVQQVGQISESFKGIFTPQQASQQQAGGTVPEQAGAGNVTPVQ